MLRTSLAALAITTIAAGSVLTINQAAQASDADCVPADAWTETIIVTEAIPATEGTPAIPAVTETITGWQRYSWTGGPVETAPAFPGAGWQANVAGDPHGIGVEGAYFVSHGGSGKGDWFYLAATTETVVVSPEVPAVPGTPAVPAVTDTVEHAAVVCEDPEVPVDPETPPTETPETPETPTEQPETPDAPTTPVVHTPQAPTTPQQAPQAPAAVPTSIDAGI
jgi:hypothetical protein